MVRILVDDVINLLQELVKIPSVCGDEAKIAKFVGDWMKQNGLPVRTLEARPNRPDVITVLKGSKPGPHLMLNGHMDTVEVGRDWTRNPFDGAIEDDRMYGRGTYDMKSGLACMLWAVAACREEGLPKRGELIVAAVVDEEAIDWGTYALIQQGFTKNVDFALVAESTDLKLVTAHKGRVVLDIEVQGRTAHSRHPSRGVNAIDRAAQLLAALPRITDPVHAIFGRSTVNTLRIEGGQDQVMLVPDRCRLLIEKCLVPGYSSQQALEDTRQLIQDLNIQALANFVERSTPFCDPFEISTTNPYVKLVANIAHKVLGREPDISFHEGPCDSCLLVNQGKVPTLEFGPTGGRLHEPDEYVEVESVKKTAEVYLELLRQTFS